MTTINTNTTATTAFVVTPDTTGTFAVNTGSGVGAERMRVDATGNVGIGTSAPLALLNVNGTGGELIRISLTPDSGTIQEPALGFATGVTNTNPAAKISALEFDASDSRASLLFYTRSVNTDSAPTEQARIDYNGGFYFNSGYGSVAAVYGCRAWVNFDGTGTPAVAASGNVSSITDNGVGDYTVNFSTAMPDTNYAVAGQCARTTTATVNNYNAYTINGSNNITTTSVRMLAVASASTNVFDPPMAAVAIFR